MEKTREEIMSMYNSEDFAEIEIKFKDDNSICLVVVKLSCDADEETDDQVFFYFNSLESLLDCVDQDCGEDFIVTDVIGFPLMAYEFKGIRFECGNIMKALEEEFDHNEYVTEGVVAISKKVYKHEEEGLNFDYKLAIDVTKRDKGWWYGLYLVPTLESLTESIQQGILEFCGLENLEEVSIDDIIADGNCVELVGEVTDTEEFDDNIVAKLANVAPIVNETRGFYLDKCVNQVGTKGWDIIKHCVNGTSLFT